MTMTDPNDVRRQFEAWWDSTGYVFSANREMAWIGYQAALQSPAVRGVVETATALLAYRHGTYPREGYLRDNDASRAQIDALVAALRTLGAGHVE